MSTVALLRVEHLVKRFGGLAATDDASLSVEDGEIHALIGPNGAGKTTLIHQLSGALEPTSGTIWFGGQNITGLPMHTRVHLGLVRSYQITSVFKRLSVLDNLALAVQAKSGSSLRFWQPARSERARYDAATAVAERVGLGPQLDRLAGALSHGEQRQLEVGLALALRPQLLLLDEPSMGLAPLMTQKIFEVIRTVADKGMTVLLVEQNAKLALEVSQRGYVMESGEITLTGESAQLLNDPKVRAAYLGE